MGRSIAQRDPVLLLLLLLLLVGRNDCANPSRGQAMHACMDVVGRAVGAAAIMCCLLLFVPPSRHTPGKTPTWSRTPATVLFPRFQSQCSP